MKFTKLIARPGTYEASTPTGPERVHLSHDRLKQWATAFDQMTSAENPLRIPAPWKHDASKPLSKEERAADNNAGFWEKIWQAKDGSLYGQLDVPRDEDASKVGTTVQEVSPYVLPNWKDGMGREWGESMMHVALVTHPVTPGQTNFEKVKTKHKGEPAMALALSQLLFADTVQEPKEPENQAGSIEANNASVSDAVAALAQVGVVLPSDTNAENVVERIVTAVQAIKGSQTSEGTPAGQNQDQAGKPTEKPLPIAMGENLMKVKVSQDGKSLEFASEDECKQFQEIVGKAEAKDDTVKHALAFATDSAKKTYVSRVERLVEQGRITPAVATNKLKPMIEAFEFSLGADGKQATTELDNVLGILEDLPSNSTGFGSLASILSDENGSPKKPEGLRFAFEQEIPESMLESGMNAISEEDADKAADAQLQNAGLASPSRKE